MSKRNSILVVTMTLLVICAATAQSSSIMRDANFESQRGPQGQTFISVEGAGLNSKMESAIKMARSTAQKTPFWMAYSFRVRPGVTIDLYSANTKNSTGTVIPKDSGSDASVETRHVGIFLLHDPDRGSVTQVEVYNLDRRHEFNGYPVYWLGQAGNDESIKLLQSLIAANPTLQVAEHATIAIALHDDPQVSLVLKDLILQSSSEKARSTAAFWFGQIGGDPSFLADLVRDVNQNTELRKQAAFSLGVNKDKDALSILEQLYGAVANREVKQQILFAASINGAKNQAVDFLIKVAQTEPDREVRKTALFWLGQKAGQQSLQGLRDVTDSSDADTETQIQAVFAISQRPQSEAVPLLINLAKVHPKAAVRKQAIFWLSQIGDERAVEFFKELLAK